MFERLFVMDSFTNDNSVVNLSMRKMSELGVCRGDVLLLQGSLKNETVAVALPDDSIDPCHIKLNKCAMTNLEASPAEKIRVSRANKVEYGFKIQVLPFENENDNKSIGTLFSKYLKPYFELSYRPLMVKNVFEVDGDEGVVEFKVISTCPQPICIVSPDTLIFCNGAPLKKEQKNDSAEVSYDDVGGCKECLELIRDVVELPLLYPEIYSSVGIKAPKGILMYGPPGTGKTLIARVIAAETRAQFLLINGPELMSKFVGESENNLRKVFHEAAQRPPSIVFIDELDAIAPKRNKTYGEVEKRMVAQLLTLMDGLEQRNNVIVIAATNQPELIDTALRRCGRFDKEIEVGLPKQEDRQEILLIHTRRMKLHDDVDLNKVASETHGFTGADLKGLCMEAASLEIKKALNNVDWRNNDIDFEMFENLKITAEKFKMAQANITPSGLREMMVEIPKVTWKDVAGLDEVKEQLMEIIQFPVAYPREFKHFDLSTSKGILLFGPPGCGKTLVVKAFANECGINFVSTKASDLVNMWFGESERNIKDLFTKARNCQPCIIFFDELDSIGKMRCTPTSTCSVEARIVNQLLVEMDGMQQNKQVFIIGATNRPDIIDSALLRPGRIDQIIYLPLPDFKNRYLLFKTLLAQTPVDKTLNLEHLANKCSGYSGADISEVVRRAKHVAMKEAIVSKDFKSKRLKAKHFDEALQTSYRSVSEEEAVMFDSMYAALKQGKGVKRKSWGNCAVKEDFEFYG